MVKTVQEWPLSCFRDLGGFPSHHRSRSLEEKALNSNMLAKFSEMTAALSQQVLAQLQLVAALGIICMILVLQSAECTRYGIMAASAEISNESLGCQMGLCCEVEVDANGTAEETSEKHSPVM